MAHGDRLSGLDASFLQLEHGPAHMHVASTSIFGGAPPTHEEFRDHIESRLHLVPRFRQKLRFVPLGQGRPVWVDDPYLNLDYHVRRTALPAPGSEEQLRNLAARIFSQQLDRSKPLWELWLVEGLEGKRFAIVGKSHHALVDGVSGMDITTERYTFDAYNAHPSPDTTYHYHTTMPGALEVLAHLGLVTSTTPGEAELEVYGIQCDGTVILGCTELDGAARSGALDAQGGHVGDLVDDDGTTHFTARYHVHVCAGGHEYTPEIQYYATCPRP